MLLTAIEKSITTFETFTKKSERHKEAYSKFTSYLKDELRLNLNEEDLKEMFNKLLGEGFIETAEGYIYLKDSEEDFEDFAKEEIEEMLESPYEVTNLFDTDDIIEMWVNETSKEEAVEIYLRHNTIFDALNLQKPKLSFYDNEIGKVMIARYN